jgi:hypothetical protein
MKESIPSLAYSGPIHAEALVQPDRDIHVPGFHCSVSQLGTPAVLDVVAIVLDGSGSSAESSVARSKDKPHSGRGSSSPNVCLMTASAIGLSWEGITLTKGWEESASIAARSGAITLDFPLPNTASWTLEEPDE